VAARGGGARWQSSALRRPWSVHLLPELERRRRIGGRLDAAAGARAVPRVKEAAARLGVCEAAARLGDL
jgi:hypothetical protein